MKNVYFFLLAIIFILPNTYAACTNCPALAFKENKKQWDKNVIYKTELHNGTVFLCNNNFTFLMEDTADMNRIRRSHHPSMYKPANFDLTVHLHAFRETFEGANTSCRIFTSNKLDEYFNYYIGKNPASWASHVNAYHNITYENLYNNINLDVTSRGINMKYNFVVKSGGNVSDISISYEGLNGIELSNDALMMKTSVGNLMDSKPYAYQIINGKEQEVKCTFQLKNTRVSFLLPDGYDRSKDLIIDPVLIFSTYSGSTADNFGYSATYDSRGNAYVAGTVFQTGQFPVTLGAFQTSWAGGIGFGQIGNFDGTGTDIGITKYDSAGTQRIYSTYLGGDNDELPHSLIVNSNDELFVLGTTASDNFPVTPNAYDTSFNGGVDAGIFYGIGVHYATGTDLFVTRFNPDGTALLASTYIGGSENDGLTYPEYQGLNYNYADEVRGEITVDKNDNVYIGSCTRSADFPVTTGAYQTTFAGNTDGVLVKMDDNLSTIIWSTFLGGDNEDAIYSIDFGPNGDVYAAGGTISTNFPNTTGTIQTTNHGGQADGFVAHLSQNGNTLLQSTYYGSAEYDQIYFVRTDKAGNVYVFGQTEDTTGIFIHNALYNKPKSGQFISKFTSVLDSVIWSTAFGSGRGTPDISPTAFLVDVCNKTYISGWGSDFFVDYHIHGAPPLSTQGLQVTGNAYQPTTDNEDFYIMVMNDDASALAYATYFGSPTDEEHVDGGTSRFDRKGVIYQSVCAGCAADCQGCTGQSTFPTTTGVVSNTNNSPNCNNAVFKFDLQLPIVVADFHAPTIGCAPYTASFTNNSKVVSSPVYTWNFGDGTTASSASPTHTYTQSGTFIITLVVTDAGSCNGTDTISKKIVIHVNNANTTLPPDTICHGHSVQIGINPGNNPSIHYTWIPSNSLSQSNSANPVATPAQSTDYKMLLSDGVCTDTFFQRVLVTYDTLHITGAELLCAGDTTQLFVTDPAPGPQPSYQWQPVNQIISGANTASPLVSPSQNTTYIVTATNASGCVTTDSIQVTITSTLPSVNITATPDTITYGDTSQLNLTSVSNLSSYQWTPNSTLSAFNILNPVAFPKFTTSYFAQVSDSHGCKRSDTITVYVIHTPCSEANLYIPDAFTPNGDGKNDVFYVRGNGITSIYFAVYDRWGQKIFETKNINQGWDGTYNGKQMDVAVFGYYAEGTCISGEKFIKKGNVTLLR